MVRVRREFIAACLFVVMSTNFAPAASSRSAPDPEGASPAVRTDGVYYFTLPGSKPLRHRVVRFYDDGMALEADVSGDPAAKANWLNRDDPNLLPGRWSLEGKVLVLKLSTGFKETERRGTTTEQGWVINDKILFKYAPVRFVPPVASAKNRRPYFVGPGKGTRVFQYDDAGRQTGMSHELEIEAADPDGDPLTFAWTASNGSIVGSGTKVQWRANGPGTVTVVVTDGKGGSIRSSTDLN